MKRSLLLCILVGIMCLGLAGCGNSPIEDAKNELEEAEKDLQESYEKYGLVEEETDVVVTSV